MPNDRPDLVPRFQQFIFCQPDGQWASSASEPLDALSSTTGGDLPKSPSHLSAAMRGRIAELKFAGIAVRFER
ncbi:MAG: hypothetical protein AB7K09_15175 [Planctomycetota bacterium]